MKAFSFSPYLGSKFKKPLGYDDSDLGMIPYVAFNTGSEDPKDIVAHQGLKSSFRLYFYDPVNI